LKFEEPKEHNHDSNELKDIQAVKEENVNVDLLQNVKNIPAIKEDSTSINTNETDNTDKVNHFSQFSNLKFDK